VVEPASAGDTTGPGRLRISHPGRDASNPGEAAGTPPVCVFFSRHDPGVSLVPRLPPATSCHPSGMKTFRRFSGALHELDFLFGEAKDGTDEAVDPGVGGGDPVVSAPCLQWERGSGTMCRPIGNLPEAPREQHKSRRDCSL